MLWIRVLALYLSLSSCNNEQVAESRDPAVAEATNQDSSPETPSVELPTELVTYASHVKPIIDEYCISCHNAEAAEANGKPDSDFSTFEAARPYGSLMPTFRLFADLSAEDQQTINDWIDNGLTEADYLAGVKEVLDTNCVSCHPAGAEARKDLPHTDFTQEQVVKLWGSQLPPFGRLKKVTSDQQAILEAWIRDGLQ
ncbi:hypothetical protein [Pseudobacteriovorax antillogorgiicola]|uniref:Uncharacterized protein n=1 Tax=Pseudobacteriovorax antillogorgiicola TaxID=1513793 RepID=A0A1Y6BUM4_9BACT|nr:hypothetical protein [Pseudobacteriovorax antillogorgiicola]TCS52413.1 hypothetical protein EDD56_109158 [Pseudobacteriovorax antillogorgiicola]SMF28821.1 hypothetical protein SAMN06296036_10955 [Pseudobacteriovorax antillogorgiicola]